MEDEGVEMIDSKLRDYREGWLIIIVTHTCITKIHSGLLLDAISGEISRE